MIHNALRKRAKGQAMMIIGVVVALGVLIGLVAIAVDGGSALLQRRTMENGAQAGAQAGIQAMVQGVVGSCEPSPCHPAYMIRNSDVYAAVKPLVNANRGGLTDAPTPVDPDYSNVYTYSVGYHYMVGAVSPAPCADCYRPAPNNGSLIPDFVDGLVVTSTVKDPTTFARALPIPITDLKVGGVSAAQLFPTCAPQVGAGDEMPFTRFRPFIEQELLDHGNEPNHLYDYWGPNPDFGGSWKNQISLAATSILTPTHGYQQHITLPDSRTTPINMKEGTGDGKTDMYNWIYYQWNGTLSLASTWPDTGSRQGDWAESYCCGNWGTNVSSGVRDVAHDFGFTTQLSGPPTNYGKAIDRTVFLWGPSLAQWNANPSDSTVAQELRNGSWRDMTINSRTNNLQDVRVRFTRVITIRYFENLAQGSSAMGLVLTQSMPGPQGDCTGDWAPGGGVYSRGIDYP